MIEVEEEILGLCLFPGSALCGAYILYLLLIFPALWSTDALPLKHL